MSDWTPSNPVLILRTCDKDMRAYGDFQWPREGYVEAPDWSAEPVCGGGLHGLLWAKGDYCYLSSAADATWMVVEADDSEVVSIGGNKVKFPRCVVKFAGTSRGAMAIMMDALTKREEKASTTGRYAHSSTTGDAAHSSTTGDAAHSSTTGRYAHSSTTGYAAHSSTTGYAAHSSTTGDAAHSSTTGDAAHSSTTGYDAIASSIGLGGKVRATNGPLIAVYLDGNDRRRVVVGYVGEDGIKPNTWYRAEAGRLVECEE